MDRRRCVLYCLIWHCKSVYSTAALGCIFWNIILITSRDWEILYALTKAVRACVARSITIEERVRPSLDVPYLGLDTIRRHIEITLKKNPPGLSDEG